MPSWSEEYGGPLRNDQIESVTQFVLNWQGPQPEGVRIEGVEAWTKPAEGAAPPTEDLEPAGEGDPASGEAIFVQNCSSCHGEAAEGGALGPSLVTEDLAGQDDAFFQDAIVNGRAGTAMPPWSGVLGGQDVADVISFLRSRQ
jgi:mono/diheme cytochrome c family protein